jgi:hypothetical protein
MCKKDTYDIKNEFINYLASIENGNIKTYIEERVIGQIKWYDKKSSKNQFWYKLFMIISIITSGLIPVLTLMLDLPFGFIIKIVISALSSTVTAISAIIALYNYRELWVQYRTNCEILKSILHRFFMKSGEFADAESEDIYGILTTLCENYITKEFGTWGSIKITKPNIQS